MPRAMPRQRLVVAQRDQRLEERGDLAVDPVAEPAAAPSRRSAGSASSSTKGCTCGRERVGAGHQPPDRVLAPHQPALLGHVDLGVGGVVELVGAQRQRRRERRDPGGAQGARGSRRRRSGSSRKRKPSSRPTNWSSILTSPFSVTVATRLSFCFSRRISTRGAPVDEPLGQPRVQRVRQPVFYRTGLLAPMVRVVDPGRRAAPRRSRCGYTPGACDSASMSPSVRSMRAICRASQSVGMRAAAVQEAEEPGAEARVLGRRDLAEVRAPGRRPRAAARPPRPRMPRRASRRSRPAPAASRGRPPRGRGPGRARSGAASRLAISAGTLREVEPGVAPLQPARAARSGGSRSPRPPRGRAAAPRR